ncbi:MAG: CvpA family protein [Phycisphaerae bacterium]|nr:CvpA family protein [Phycisphaerae bacterium]
MEFFAQLILIVIFLILTFFQVFSQGVFSCIIMAVLAVVSSITAFNYYEPLAALMSDYGVSVVGPQAVSFLGLFALTLFGLRQFSDRFIRGNMNFPKFIDRVGCTFFASITSMVMVGVIAIGFQLMPVDAKIMGFDRCENLEDAEEDNHLWIRADEFVLWIIEHSSQYCFANNNNFSQLYPNGFLREQYFNRITPKGYEGMRHEAAHNALLQTKDSFFYRTVDPAEISILIDKKKVEPTEKETYILLTIEIDSGTEGSKKDKGSTGARDNDGKIRMAYAHMKLVGYDPKNPKGESFAVYPIAYKHAIGPGGLPENKPMKRKEMANLKMSLPMQGVKPDDGDFSDSGSLTKTLLFKWPAKLSKDNIMFLEFKRSSKADISIKKLLEGITLEEEDPAAKQEDETK